MRRQDVMRAVLAFAAVSSSAWGAPPEVAAVRPPARKIGERAPRWVLDVANPARVGYPRFNLHDWVGEMRSHRDTVVLTFSASDCAPCRVELLELKRGAAALHAARAQVVVVIADKQPEGAEIMRKFLIDEHDIPFPVVYDNLLIVPKRYGISKLPTTVVLDAEGAYAWQKESRTTTEEILKAVRAARDEVAPPPPPLKAKKRGR